MKLDCILEEIPIISTDTKPQKYTLTITGIGTVEECNHVMDLLMQGCHTRTPPEERDEPAND